MNANDCYDMEIIIENAFKNGEYNSIIFMVELMIDGIIDSDYMNKILTTSLSMWRKNMFFPFYHIIKMLSYDSKYYLPNLFGEFLYWHRDNEPVMKRFIPYIINLSYGEENVNYSKSMHINKIFL